MRPISRAKRSVSPIARRAGSRDAKEGLPEEESGGFTPVTIPRSYRIGLWPRRNDFQAHSASLFMGESWSVSLMMTFAPLFAGGFVDHRLSCIGESTSSKPGEIQSAGPSNSTSLTLL